MTDTIPNVPHVLKPCPFCGDTPELPDGAGTQYEIECGGCGQAMASVQICDLMTLEERVADAFTDYRYGEEFVERAKVQAIEHWNNRAPSPAGVDGLKRYEVFPYLDDEVAEIDICESDDGSFVKYEDAQAIIDGLRGEADQQAQRIGELASHLEFAVTMLTVAGLAGNAQVEAMRSALSAGKEAG